MIPAAIKNANENCYYSIILCPDRQIN